MRNCLHALVVVRVLRYFWSMRSLVCLGIGPMCGREGTPPLLRERVPMRIALRRRPGVHGVVEAAEEILCAVPGIEIVDLQQPAVALRRASFRPRGQRHLGELHLARRAPR